MCPQIKKRLAKLLHSHPRAKAVIIWGPSHQDIKAIKLADAAANLGVDPLQVIASLPDATAARKRIKKKLIESKSIHPPPTRTDMSPGLL